MAAEVAASAGADNSTLILVIAVIAVIVILFFVVKSKNAAPAANTGNKAPNTPSLGLLNSIFKPNASNNNAANNNNIPDSAILDTSTGEQVFAPDDPTVGTLTENEAADLGFYSPEQLAFLNG